MDRVFTEASSPESKLKHSGVAIRNSGRGRHVGLIFKREGEWRMLHMGWHHQLDDESIPNSDGQHLWVDPEPAIDEIRLENLAAYCRLVSERNVDKGLPYGFSEPKNWFDPSSGEARSAPDGKGLTCASFVLAVFSANGLPLINEDTWKIRDDDKDYHEWVIECLGRTRGVTDDHIKRLRESLPTIRYRPEEVAGAAASDPIPADFAPCCKFGMEIIQLLNKIAEDNG